RMEVLDRIVQMKCRQPLEPDEFVELAESIFISFRSANVVTGRECMLGIEAQPQPLVLRDRVENLRHLLERMPQVAALARCDLERDLHLEAFARGMRLVD